MLSIRNLSKTYANGVRALDQVSLTLPNGLFGLLGPNGAGKSTLMRTIAGLQAPDSGEIHFQGIDVVGDPGALRRRLGFLPQDFGVYPRLSAPRLLDHFAVLKGVSDRKRRREQVEAVLHETNLAEAGNRAVSSFSGGMHRRFGIAVSLLGDPKLMIVDEPTAGLDPLERNRFHQLLARLSRDRVVLFSTHIVEDVRDLCSRAVILAGGRVLMEGETDGMVALLRGKVWRKTVPHDQEAAIRDRYNVISSRLQAGRLMLHVYAEEALGDGFQPARPDLEDVYFHALNNHDSNNRKG